MQNPLVVENSSLNAPVPHHVQHGDGPDFVRYAVRLHKRLHMIFLFKKFGDLEILCGIAFNGQLVGHEGPIWKPVQVTSLKGFKVATVENHFVGIQIKDGSGWQLTWQGDYLQHSSYAKFEWDSTDIDIVVSHDVSIL